MFKVSYIENRPRPPVTIFFGGSNFLAILLVYPLSFCQIILNSDQWLKVSLATISHAPGGHVFWQIKFVLAIIVEGHLGNFPVKSR